MPLNKAPGPDGFTTEFFKSSWNTIGSDMVAGIKSFFEKGFLPKGINSTILTLLPKKDDASSIKDYRPISCCNVIYKIISKILANRLKDLLPVIVSSSQTAFIQGRLLMENILLSSELVKDYHKDNISPRCTMQIDIAKAFDSVQWDFLLKTLEALNFPTRFIHWIKLCISTPTFSVQLNGELSGYFGSSRGLRQGCPLSPYLFVLCINVLSNLLNSSASIRKFDYHPKCRNIRLTHLCFADDLLIFCDGKKRSIQGALKVFEIFSQISGLQVNLGKSTIFAAGISNEVIHAIQSTYNIKSGTLPVRYLGLPLMSKRMSPTDYKPLVDRIRSKLCSWTGRFLSYAGRLQLLKSVIAGIINFWISSFRLPKKCITEINSLCSAFLWSGPELNKKKAKISWNDVCRPTNEGGLGIRNILDSNKVSSLKLIWRLLSSKSLWAEWANTYLLRSSSFWSPDISSTTGSWIWRKLIKLRPIAERFHRIELGNGKSSSFWYDHWSKLGRIFDLTGARGCINLGIPLQATVQQAGLSFRPRNHRCELLNNISKIAKTAFQSLQLFQCDNHKWLFKEDNYKTQFCSTTTWDQIRNRTSKTPWRNGIWFQNATPKHRFLAWVAVQDRLSTGDRISIWNSGARISCIFCGCLLESRNHIFFICSYSGHIWREIFGNLIPNTFSQHWDTNLSLISEGTPCKTTTFILRYSFQSSLYHIWRERNNRRHGQPGNPPSIVVKLIDKNMRNRLSSLPNKQGHIYNKGLSKWFDSRF